MWKPVSRIVATAIGLMLFGTPAPAQDRYPSRPIRLVIPVAPGGMTDIVARLIAHKLSERLQQPVIPDNRAGAGGNIGAEAVAQAKADGYTLLMAFPAPLAVNPYLFAKLGYDPIKDFVPVSLLATYPMAVAVHPSMPVKSIDDLVALAKRADNPLTYGSAGIASTAHLGTELFRQKAGIRLLHVPYRGAAPAMNDLIAGNVQMVFDSLTLIMPQHEAGRIRALAVTSRERSNAYPDLATISEAAGLSGFEVIGWFGIVAPAGTPEPVIGRLTQEFAAIVADPAVAKELTSRGMQVVGAGPSQFRNLIERERDTWRRLIAEAGITAE